MSAAWEPVEPVDRLPHVTPDQRQAILAAPRTTEAHRAFMAEIAAMRMVETGGAPSEATVPQIFTVAAWNIERCLFPEKSAALLAAQTPDVVLLSEVDCGMARTAQRHPTAEIAAALGMHYAYGVEFFELGLGGETERPFCVDDHNEAGWHGNAVLSRAAPIATTLIRLDDHGHWYIDGPFSWDRDQPRIGGRMAIATIIPTVAGNLCVVSVHLESNADSAHRGRQMERLIEAIDSFAPDLPVIIGGDLNTGNSKDAPDWRDESLFDIARENGYSWDNNADGMTTRRSFLTPHPTRSMKLDWFAARGLSMDGAAIVPALDPAGEPLSDHELIVGHFAIP
ncbi:endonuclease/exonuclease/phosphatase family protein [Hoeflea sp.]|uniref:endonuclease/exonuclease/phosphatase family protein n=1 Tax=Hoeflea sp. TaxID=1940281 RepID=UPI0025C5757E|nr:endonuclease/exonuclease/phosphatase family protein [Hoeflea sp.]